ncbi:MAG: hypothetical protein AAF371_16725 [Pseudomonadota bacterium]
MCLPALKAEFSAETETARKLLAEMRQVAAGPGPAGAKIVEARRLADQLRGVLAELDSAKAAALIRAGVEALPEEVGKVPLSAKTMCTAAAY